MKIHTFKVFTGSHSSSSSANDGKHVNPPPLNGAECRLTDEFPLMN